MSLGNLYSKILLIRTFFIDSRHIGLASLILTLGKKLNFILDQCL